MAWASVRLSECPSVCLPLERYQNGASYDHRILTMGCPKVCGFSWQNFAPLGEGVPLELERHRGVPPPPKKEVILPLLALIVWKRLQAGTDLLHIITNTGDGFFRFINVDDLKWPQTPYPQFFLQFVAATQISRVNCDEMDVDRPRQPAN